MKDMLGRDEAISLESALSLVKESIRPSLKEETVRPRAGRVISRDVFSPEDLPPFSRSTVDGFAVVAEDTFGMPCYLSLVGEVRMASAPEFGLKRGEAAVIPTGGMLPEGADAVVMLEHAQRLDAKTIEVQKPAAPGENVITKGEDFKEGEIVLRRGRRLRPQDVAALAGLGIVEVFVHERPVVSIIATGDELLPAESPLRPGFVRDMNSSTLSGLVETEGGIAVLRGIVKDDYALIRDALEASLGDSHMALISGGSSVGTRDLVAGVIKEMGVLLFHGVSMKPGKPMIAGHLRGKPVFGLPGHPAAVMLCFEVFVRPALRLLSGVEGQYASGAVKATLTRAIRSTPGRREFFRVSLVLVDGRWLAAPVLGKSGLIRTLVRADGTVSVPPEKQGLSEGELVEVRLF